MIVRIVEDEPSSHTIDDGFEYPVIDEHHLVEDEAVDDLIDDAPEDDGVSVQGAGVTGPSHPCKLLEPAPGGHKIINMIPSSGSHVVFDIWMGKSRDDEEEETSEDFSESDDYESSDYEMESNSDDDKSYYKNIDDNVEWSGKKFDGPLAVEDVCEFGEEDIMKSDDDFDSIKGSDNEKERPHFPVFNPIEIYRPTFELGMIFSTRTELRQSIHSHAIITRRSINITKNDKSRLHAKCVEKGCGWKLHALKVTNECTYQRNLKGFRIEAMKDVKCHISSYQAYNAKRKAIEIIEGVPDEQYSLLWDFVDEVKRTNPGSTVIVGTDQLAGENRFDRIYMCLHALRMGFLAGCRPLIGVDGCHLKDKHGGVLLTAVGVDPNNNIYPIAYALVEKETRETWDWFLTIGQAFKSILWKAARATTVNEFSRNMEEMNELDENAFQWLNDKPPQNWSRSHFNTHPRCDMLLNNGCESFNSSILEAREKPIVSMLEWIMEYLMTKLQKNRDRAEKKWSGDLCPKIKKRIHNNIEKLGDCIPIKADDYHYQISCFDGNQYNVDLNE
ncbi:PREDICTED: uncharacterized protein LOC105957010 [Erythranthe guttata]|uniref:uncharacterized protein LOC105957010 n=1 Tax=Erythranthe guttata TaxID=4155 RepID=UPI00064DF033|nr:PREDICTED: uncharacterized protein LOC105957010 [Erythranthe guttata]|eukprot:XP_012836375.1 PREDICTED: uncharacterized protein LOC105957010 [Erythranthe guttata]